MYHEEEVIDGVLHYRGSEDGEFIPYTNEQVINKYLNCNKEVNKLIRKVDKLKAELNQRNDGNTDPLGELT